MTFEECLHDCAKTAYEEPHSDLHDNLTKRAVDLLCAKLEPGMRVLDVGCGYGFAAERFKDRGMDVTGLTTIEAEFRKMRQAGFACIHGEMHQAILGTYDAIYARHVLEHSIAPMFLLRRLSVALKPSGWLYAEMPEPDTECHHERNPNHYSVLPGVCWAQLFARVGLKIIDGGTIEFQTMAGNDSYVSILCQKTT